MDHHMSVKVFRHGRVNQDQDLLSTTHQHLIQRGSPDAAGSAMLGTTGQMEIDAEHVTRAVCQLREHNL